MSNAHYQPDSDYFTLVFKGDVRNLKRSPLFEQTEFGECVAISIGDMTEELKHLQKEILELERSQS